MMLVVPQILLMLLAVMLPVVQWKSDASQHWEHELRQLEAQKIWLVSALNVLKDHRHVTRELSDAPAGGLEGVDSISLSLIEAIKRKALKAQLDLTKLTVTQSDMQQMESEVNHSTVHSLRVTFAVTMERAMSLLPLLDALSDAAGWRPTEVRGCSVIRLTESPVSLRATCSVDVYYFPELHR